MLFLQHFDHQFFPSCGQGRAHHHQRCNVLVRTPPPPLPPKKKKWKSDFFVDHMCLPTTPPTPPIPTTHFTPPYLPSLARSFTSLLFYFFSFSLIHSFLGLSNQTRHPPNPIDPMPVAVGGGSLSPKPNNGGSDNGFEHKNRDLNRSDRL